jgi:DNA-directed RNA polymerase specialized sigma24 family protein
MDGLRQGDQDARRELVDLFYPELRRLAATKMKDERSAHTWQPTELVHELYLELIKTRGLNPRDYGDSERAAFFGLAGQMMRRLLIHHARPCIGA